MNFICEPLKSGNKCYNFEVYWYYIKKSGGFQKKQDFVLSFDTFLLILSNLLLQ